MNTIYSLIFTAAVIIVGYFYLRLRSTSVTPPKEAVESVLLDATPDYPMSFGYKITWLAVRSSDTVNVSASLALTDVVTANWHTGITTSYAGIGRKPRRVFVTPPVGDWTLVVGWLPDSGDVRTPDLATPFLESIGKQFNEVQYFSTHRVVEYHAWAKVIQGRIVRAYAYIGEQGHKIWDKGTLTIEEQELGFHFFDPESNEAKDNSYWEREDLAFPNEENVMRLAGKWSVDPTQLESMSMPPSTGLVGFMQEGIQIYGVT